MDGMTETRFNPAPPRRLAAPRPAWGMLARLALALARRRERQWLAEMEPRMLHDIGVTRAQAAAEVAKPWWRG